ncbi:ArsA family ATPase [Hydrogenivirga sp.]
MLEKKLFFFGGKGGVGKTTLSSSLALLLARRGRKTLLISTDPAHSLSDVLGVGGREINEVTENLFVLEIDPYGVVREYIERALKSLEPAVSPEVYEQVREVFHSVEETPGTEEAAVIERLSEVILSNYEDYTHFVVDTAPTGHTLQMLRTVGRVGRWLEELLRKRRKAQSFWSAGGREREDTALRMLEDRRRRFLRFSELLTSSETTFIPVLIPEKLPIEETQRLIDSLEKMGVSVGAVVVNRVLPEAPRDEFLIKRKEQERLYLHEIERRFGRYRLVKIGMRDRDVKGVEDLGEVALELGRRLGI